MPSPFPGMDPYLEQPAFWSSFHSRLIVAIADYIAPQIMPKYYIEVETRTYSQSADSELLIGIPDAVVFSSVDKFTLPQNITDDTSSVAILNRPQQVRLPMRVEVKERYLEVRELGTDAVITAIELLSPANKRTGKGRVAYEEKRQQILDSASHFIEIDLLRSDTPILMTGNNFNWDYRILVSRSEQRPIADLYGFMLPEPIPIFPLPLKSEDKELAIDLQSILNGVYERAGYRFRIDYRQPVPSPVLSQAEQEWVTTLLSSL
jgi:virulence-associated protein VagC